MTNPDHSTFSNLAGLCLRHEVTGDSTGVYLVCLVYLVCGSVLPVLFLERDRPNKPDRRDEPIPATRREVGSNPLSSRENGASRENPVPSCAPGERGVSGKTGSVSKERERIGERRLWRGSWRHYEG
jgi:hypothetical protein